MDHKSILKGTPLINDAGILKRKMGRSILLKCYVPFLATISLRMSTVSHLELPLIPGTVRRR